MKSRTSCTSTLLNNSSKEEVTKIFGTSIVKISTPNKDVLDSEWTLTSRALRLVRTWQQIRMCASCMTNPKSVNDYFIPTRQGWFLLMPPTVGLIASNSKPSINLFIMFYTLYLKHRILWRGFTKLSLKNETRTCKKQLYYVLHNYTISICFAK